MAQYSARTSRPFKLFPAVTLLDALGVAAVSLLLAACLFPIVVQARESSRLASDMTRSRVACLAASMYTLDYDGDDDLVPNGVHVRRGGGGHAGGSHHKSTNNGISYHGGPLILGTTNVYYIWYGNWSGNTATTILTDLAQSIGGSSYYNINTTYYDGSSTRVSNAVQYAGSTPDSYSQGTSLSDAQIQTVVSNAIASGKLSKDTNGVYFVLTSSDVTASSGFCTQYCGWHTYGTISGSNIKYAFVGNPDRCPSACEWQTTSPNGNAGADGMASIIAHELEEAVTDANLNAWYDSRGYENADKCAWTFGTTSTASNGSEYNVTLGSRQYLIQQNWVNAGGGYCSMKY